MSFYLGQLSDFCVFGFAFLSGYAHMMQSNQMDYYKRRLKGLLSVFCSYSIDNGSALSAFPMEYQECYRGYEEIKEGLLARYYSRFHNGLYSVCNKLFDRGMLQKNAVRFNELLIRAEDAWFVFDCLKHVNTLRYIQKPLYVYRQVASSTMHTIQQDRYERSKNFRKKLLAEAEVLGIQFEQNGFYYEYLYEAFVYCRAMCIQGRHDEVLTVLNDPYFFNACQYCKELPTHLKVLCALERFHKNETSEW